MPSMPCSGGNTINQRHHQLPSSVAAPIAAVVVCQQGTNSHSKEPDFALLSASLSLTAPFIIITIIPPPPHHHHHHDHHHQYHHSSSSSDPLQFLQRYQQWQAHRRGAQHALQQRQHIQPAIAIINCSTNCRSSGVPQFNNPITIHHRHSASSSSSHQPRHMITHTLRPSAPCGAAAPCP